MPLQLRPEQLRALQTVPEREFQKHVSTFARQHIAKAVEPLSDQELLWRVHGGVKRARAHGFAWQSSIAAFVILMLRFAPNFDQYPPIRAILSGKGEERADALLALPGEDWEEVEERCDLHAWYDFAPGAAENLP